MTSDLISITSLLDDHIEALEEPRLPDGLYHPSSMHFCDRKTVYEIRGVEPTNPPSAKTKRKFRIGHLIHALVQGAIAASSKVKTFYPEFGIYNAELRITGHGDGLIFFEDGTAIMLEIKSTAASGFKYGLKDSHVEQAADYAVAVADGLAFIENPDGTRTPIPALGDKLLGILVCYLEKENANTNEFFVPFDPAWRDKQQAHVDRLEPYRLDPESLPRRLRAVKSGKSWRKPWQCNPEYCPVFDRCMSDPVEIKPVEEDNEW